MSDSRIGKMRLLASANDPGAAYQLIEVLKRARETGRVEICVVAGATTLPIFERAGFSAKQAYAPRVNFQASKGEMESIGEARALIAEFLPDAILVGLSGPDRGIDEGLVACAGHRPTYAVQDFWGDVNPGFGSLSGTYFVLDEFAAGITQQRAPGSRVIVTGSARHAAMRGLDPLMLRKRYRAALDVPASALCAVFFGQPLWMLPGYALTLTRLSKGLVDFSKNVLFCYRPHPKESCSDAAKALHCLRRPGLDVKLYSNARMEASLCGADVMMTCYSSCGLDLSYISKFSKSPLGVMVFSMFEEDVRRFYRATTSLQRLPLVEQGMASIIEEQGDTEKILREACSEHGRMQKWQAAVKDVRDLAGAAEQIVRTIMHDWTSFVH